MTHFFCTLCVESAEEMFASLLGSLPRFTRTAFMPAFLFGVLKHVRVCAGHIHAFIRMALPPISFLCRAVYTACALRLLTRGIPN